MDALPVTHTLTKEEAGMIESLTQKERDLHNLAVQWLQTSYRLEWSHMWKQKK